VRRKDGKEVGGERETVGVLWGALVFVGKYKMKRWLVFKFKTLLII
jgi:hypothetical protein